MKILRGSRARGFLLSDRGQVLPIVACMMLVLIGMAALARRWPRDAHVA